MSDPDLPNPNSDAERVHAELPSGFSPGYGNLSADPYDHAVPPGYDWPTHGGYLGCLLGLMASCLIGGFVGSTFFPTLAHYHWMPGWVAGLLTVMVFVLIVVVVGRLGYILGKRFFREYPQPGRKTWGEDDDYVDPAVAKRAEAERAIAEGTAAASKNKATSDETGHGQGDGQTAFSRDG